MAEDLIISGPSKDFEAIKKIDENGIEYWEARELMPHLGYDQWRNFEEVIKKAVRACIGSAQEPKNHFADISKMVEVGSGAKREVKDYKLDRYACYLIAQNGESTKPQIALAQTYFALQTRKQEIFEKLSEGERRLFIRGEVKTFNRKLSGTAKGAGVINFGMFNNEGYRGLYGMSLSEVERRKGLKKGELLDRAGASELAANLFRITQTDEKITNLGTKGQLEASRIHHDVGEKIRRTIKDIGGELPEHLKPEKHIREVRKEMKQLRNAEKRNYLGNRFGKDYCAEA
jgi:DNA-damage-inducible protein D